MSLAPEPVEETGIRWEVVFLYVVIIVGLTAGLCLSLNVNPPLTDLADRIVAAMMTIAGFAVGVNAHRS